MMTSASSIPDEHEHQRRRFGVRMLVLALAAGLIAGAGLALLGGRALSPSLPPSPASTKADPSEGPEELPPGIVEISTDAQRNAGMTVVSVANAPLPVTIDLTGSVEADAARVSQIRPLGRGVVERLSVQVGQVVTRGQALLAYDNIELGQGIGEYLSERAALAQTKTDLDVKRRNADRAEALYKTEAIAQQTLELRRAEFRSAEAMVASQEARVARVEEQLHRFGMSDADLGRLAGGDGSVHRTASHATLRAPFDGIITKQNVAAGEVVGPERDLFTVANLSTVWVQGDVYEKDLARIKPGVTVPLRTDAYPGRTFEGRLTYISDLIDPETRTAKVRVVVDNADGALKLDMFARLVIPTTEQRETIVVPTEAIQTIDNAPVVFVQQAPTRFERRAVTLGPVAGRVTAATNGVNAGERIVGAGSFYLKTALLRERIGDEH